MLIRNLLIVKTSKGKNLTEKD
ncbi:hypothetical protein [Spiroplasma taiwanense]